MSRFSTSVAFFFEFIVNIWEVRKQNLCGDDSCPNQLLVLLGLRGKRMVEDQFQCKIVDMHIYDNMFTQKVKESFSALPWDKICLRAKCHVYGAMVMQFHVFKKIKIRTRTICEILFTCITYACFMQLSYMCSTLVL